MNGKQKGEEGRRRREKCLPTHAARAGGRGDICGDGKGGEGGEGRAFVGRLFGKREEESRS